MNGISHYAAEVPEELARVAEKVPSSSVSRNRTTRCKHCRSDNLVRIGTPGGVQRFRCRDCSRTFMDNGAMPGMRVDATSIGAALAMYYAGFKLRDIRCRLNRVFEIEPSISTIHDWIHRYTKIAIESTWNVVPKPSDTWVVLESPPDPAGQHQAYVDIFDHASGFLLDFEIAPSSLSASRNVLIDRLWAQTGVRPCLILRHQTSEAFSRQRTGSAGFEGTGREMCEVIADPEGNLISRFRMATEARARVLRGLCKTNGIELAARGWWVHHNFIRRFGITGFTTPAALAGLAAPFRHWADVVQLKSSQSPVGESVGLPDREEHILGEAPRLGMLARGA